MLASVEGESQKLEHNFEESNVQTKTKIKERLKDENKCFFLHKQPKLSVLQTKRVSSTEYASNIHIYVCAYETKPTLLSSGSSLLFFAFSDSKPNIAISLWNSCASIVCKQPA